MPKKRLTKIAEDHEIEFDEALRISEEKLPVGSLSRQGQEHLGK
jgi:hypothetical protein